MPNELAADGNVDGCLLLVSCDHPDLQSVGQPVSNTDSMTYVHAQHTRMQVIAVLMTVPSLISCGQPYLQSMTPESTTDSMTCMHEHQILHAYDDTIDDCAFAHLL